MKCKYLKADGSCAAGWQKWKNVTHDCPMGDKVTLNCHMKKPKAKTVTVRAYIYPGIWGHIYESQKPGTIPVTITYRKYKK